MQTTVIKTSCAIIASLLIASASALAQNTPPAPVEVVRGNDITWLPDSLVMPRQQVNLYLEGGPVYNYAKGSGEDGDLNYFGGYVAFGWRINKNNKIQAELGILGATTDYTVSGWSGNNYVSAKVTEDHVIMPWLASYSYCIALDRAQRFELRLTPSVGFTTHAVKLKIDSNYGYYRSGYYSDDASATAFTFGGGVGVTYHFNRRFYVDGGVRYLRTNSTSYDLFGVHADIGASDNYTVNAAFGWKF